MSDTQPSGSVYYRFTDASGRIHLVDSLDRVPVSERAHAQRVELSAGAPPPSDPSPSRLLTGATPDLRSFALGALCAVLLLGIFKWLPGTMRFLLRLGIVAGLAALLLGGYFGWLRRSAGHESGALATPQALLDDAKGAVDKMNERMRAQDQELKDIEQQSKSPSTQPK